MGTHSLGSASNLDLANEKSGAFRASILGKTEASPPRWSPPSAPLPWSTVVSAAPVPPPPPLRTPASEEGLPLPRLPPCSSPLLKRLTLLLPPPLLLLLSPLSPPPVPPLLPFFTGVRGARRPRPATTAAAMTSATGSGKECRKAATVGLSAEAGGACRGGGVGDARTGGVNSGRGDEDADGVDGAPVA